MRFHLQLFLIMTACAAFVEAKKSDGKASLKKPVVRKTLRKRVYDNNENARKRQIGYSLHKAVRTAHANSNGNAWIPDGPCARNGTYCMNARGLKYVNELRQRAGTKLKKHIVPLTLGTEAMVESALRQSHRMKLQHETFIDSPAQTYVGCFAAFNGENIASTHLILGARTVPSDPAYLCVEKFAKTKDHFLHMIDPNNRQFAMGVYVDKQDFIWCTQLFTLSVKFSTEGKAKCKQAPSGFENFPLHPFQETKLPMEASTGYVFKKNTYTDKYDDGSAESFDLKCGYCSKLSGQCLGEDESILIDHEH